MSPAGNVVHVPYIGAVWPCMVVQSSGVIPRERISHFKVGAAWIDAEVALDSLFRNRLETALRAMPANTVGAAS